MNSLFIQRLIQLCKEKEIKPQQLRYHINVQSATITKWTKGELLPNPSVLIKLSQYFNCSIDYLLGLSDIKEVITSDNLRKNIPEVDKIIIDHYKSLTPHDREIVDHIFNMKPETFKPIIRYETVVADEVIYFPLVKQKASAGIGSTTHQSSNETNRIGFPLSETPEEATHAIIIDGYSMEPTFFDGQIVFINAEKDCNDGDFGIFQVTTPDKTDIYCKQLKYDNQGRKYLHSVSDRADDPEFIESDETILLCIGKIITK